MKFEEKILIEKAELVLNKLTHLEKQVFDKNADPKKGFASRDFGIEQWDWPQGVGLYSMEKLQKYFGDTRYDAFFKNWYKKNKEEGFPSANINTTAPYAALLSFANRIYDKEIIELCEERAKWLMEKLPRTTEGGFQHVTTGLYDKNDVIPHEQQIWIDTLFMAVLFLAKAGVVFEKKSWVEEAIYQILLHMKYLFDKQGALFCHGWSFLRNDNFGGVFWARGNSWFTYGILELMDVLKDQMEAPDRRHIVNTFKAQVKRLSKLQSESGLWHTVLEDPDSYEEVSGSAAITAGIYKGIRSGLLDSSYLPCAEKALQAILREIGEDGVVNKVSGGTGMGMDEQHYKDIIIAPMPYGQAMVLLAIVEALSFYKGDN